MDLKLLILLIVFQEKHWIADYPLQGQYMLGKFKEYPHFILPLLAHGFVHGLFTFAIASFVQPWKYAMVLGAMDMLIHSTVDFIKANPSLGGRFEALSKREMKSILSYVPSLGADKVEELFGAQLKSNRYFWWTLGLDQKAHHLTHYLLIWLMI